MTNIRVREDRGSRGVNSRPAEAERLRWPDMRIFTTATVMLSLPGPGRLPRPEGCDGPPGEGGGVRRRRPRHPPRRRVARRAEPDAVPASATAARRAAIVCGTDITCGTRFRLAIPSKVVTGPALVGRPRPVLFYWLTDAAAGLAHRAEQRQPSPCLAVRSGIEKRISRNSGQRHCSLGRSRRKGANILRLPSSRDNKSIR